jgi:hypothetical protein
MTTTACGLTQCGGHVLTGEGWLVMFLIICGACAVWELLKKAVAHATRVKDRIERTGR